MKMFSSKEPLRCSFCHKTHEQVEKLISSPSDYPRAYICNECVKVCHQILEDEENSGTQKSATNQEDSNQQETGQDHPTATKRFVDFLTGRTFRRTIDAEVSGEKVQ